MATPPASSTADEAFLELFQKAQRIKGRSGEKTAVAALTEDFIEQGLSEHVAKGLAQDVLEGEAESFKTLVKQEESDVPGIVEEPDEEEVHPDCDCNVHEDHVECECEGEGLDKQEQAEDFTKSRPSNELRVFKDANGLVIHGPASVAKVDSENDLITGEALKSALPELLKRGRLSFQHTDILCGEILEKWESPNGETFKTTVRPIEPSDVQRYDMLDKSDVEPGTEALFVVGKIYTDDEIGQDVAERILKGELRAFSISGQAVEQEQKTDCSGFTCKLVNKIDEISLSAVTVCDQGMNDASGFEVISKRQENEPIMVADDDGKVHKFAADGDGRVWLTEASPEDVSKQLSCPSCGDETRPEMGSMDDTQFCPSCGEEGISMEDVGKRENAAEEAIDEFVDKPRREEEAEDEAEEEAPPAPEGEEAPPEEDGEENPLEELDKALDGIVKEGWEYDGQTDSGRHRWVQPITGDTEYTDEPHPPGKTVEETGEREFDVDEERQAELDERVAEEESNSAWSDYEEHYEQEEKPSVEGRDRMRRSEKTSAEALKRVIEKSEDGTMNIEKELENIARKGPIDTPTLTAYLHETARDLHKGDFDRAGKAIERLSKNMDVVKDHYESMDRAEQLDIHEAFGDFQAYIRDLKNNIPDGDIEWLQEAIDFISEVDEYFADNFDEHAAHRDKAMKALDAVYAKQWREAGPEEKETDNLVAINEATGDKKYGTEAERVLDFANERGARGEGGAQYHGQDPSGAYGRGTERAGEQNWRQNLEQQIDELDDEELQAILEDPSEYHDMLGDSGRARSLVADELRERGVDVGNPGDLEDAEPHDPNVDDPDALAGPAAEGAEAAQQDAIEDSLPPILSEHSDELADKVLAGLEEYQERPEELGHTSERGLVDETVHFYIEENLPYDKRDEALHRKDEIVDSIMDAVSSTEKMQKALGDQVQNQPITYGGRHQDLNDASFEGLPLGYPQKPTQAVSVDIAYADDSSIKAPQGQEEDYAHPAGSDRTADSANEDTSTDGRPQGVAMKDDIEKTLDSILKDEDEEDISGDNNDDLASTQAVPDNDNAEMYSKGECPHHEGECPAECEYEDKADDEGKLPAELEENMEDDPDDPDDIPETLEDADSEVEKQLARLNFKNKLKKHVYEFNRNSARHRIQEMYKGTLSVIRGKDRDEDALTEEEEDEDFEDVELEEAGNEQEHEGSAASVEEETWNGHEESLAQDEDDIDAEPDAPGHEDEAEEVLDGELLEKPKEVHDCVESLQEDGHDEDTAWAICESQHGKSDPLHSPQLANAMDEITLKSDEVRRLTKSQDPEVAKHLIAFGALGGEVFEKEYNPDCPACWEVWSELNNPKQVFDAMKMSLDGEIDGSLLSEPDYLEFKDTFPIVYENLTGRDMPRGMIP